MQLDKELYRKAYESFKEWNEAKLLDRVRDADTLTPQEAWRRYVALWKFGWKLCPQQSEWQQKQKAEILELYYQRVQKLEARRKAHGRKRP